MTVVMGPRLRGDDGPSLTTRKTQPSPRFSAVQLPEQADCDPAPRQEPEPERPNSRPEPLARESPRLTVTRTAPLGATCPLKLKSACPAYDTRPFVTFMG